MLAIVVDRVMSILAVVNHLQVNDVVAFAAANVEVDGVPERAIKVILVRDNPLTCTIGFLPRHVAVRYGFQPPIWFAKITEIYELSDNTQKRKSAYENKGIAKYE